MGQDQLAKALVGRLEQLGHTVALQAAGSEDFQESHRMHGGPEADASGETGEHG